MSEKMETLQKRRAMATGLHSREGQSAGDDRERTENNPDLSSGLVCRERAIPPLASAPAQSPHGLLCSDRALPAATDCTHCRHSRHWSFTSCSHRAIAPAVDASISQHHSRCRSRIFYFTSTIFTLLFFHIIFFISPSLHLIFHMPL